MKRNFWIFAAVLAALALIFVGCGSGGGGTDDGILHGTVTIGGGAGVKAGDTLTAVTGALNETGGFSYQWEFSENGTSGWLPIQSKNDSTYFVDVAYIDKYIRVTVTHSSRTGSVSSPATHKVRASENLLDFDGQLQILGNLIVGEPLTADYNGSVADFKFHWERSPDVNIAANWIEIPEAGDADNYLLTEADNQQYIRVTISKDGYGPLHSEATARIMPQGTAALEGEVKIEGSAIVGQTLSAITTDVTTGAGDFSYHWYYADNANGNNLHRIQNGNGGIDFILQDEEHGSYIYLRVERADAFGMLTSQPTGMVTWPDFKGSVSISGEAKIGEELTAVISGLESPRGDPVYKWMRSDNQNGTGNTADAGQGSEYTLKAADLGKYITLTVSYTKNEGSKSATTTQAAVKGTLKGILVIDGDTEISKTLTANIGGLNADEGLVYVWKRGATGSVDAVIGGNSPTYQVTADDYGLFITVTVTSPDYFEGAQTSVEVGPITKIAMTGNVAITGDAVLGGTLIASIAGITEPTSGFTYKWERSLDGVGWEDATGNITSSSYSVVAADMSRYIRVTLSHSDYKNSVAVTQGVVTYQILEGYLSISGTVEIGETLTADVSGLTNTAGTPIYQWIRHDNADGTGNPTNVGTESTYKLIAADQNKYITLEVEYTENEGSKSATVGPATVKPFRIKMGNDWITPTLSTRDNNWRQWFTVDDDGNPILSVGIANTAINFTTELILSANNAVNVDMTPYKGIKFEYEVTGAYTDIAALSQADLFRVMLFQTDATVSMSLDPTKGVLLNIPNNVSNELSFETTSSGGNWANSPNNNYADGSIRGLRISLNGLRPPGGGTSMDSNTHPNERLIIRSIEFVLKD